MSSSDRIEKEIVLKAPRSRVWRALSNAEQFGAWFGCKLDGAFAAGATIRGRMTHAGYEHMSMELFVDRIEPESYFSYRWHPYAVDPKVDYSSEPTTLVEFRLEAKEGGGTVLFLTESGFDAIPRDRQIEAFRMNERGWTTQMTNIARHVEPPA
jgi:uncharacterized protein YndB with AHSA1/START domain